MRLYGKQIREEILTKLTNDLNNYLQSIDNPEFLIWPKNKIQVFSGAASAKKLPECVVMVSGGNAGEQFTQAVENQAEIYTVNIEITTKEPDQERLNLIVDSWEQGLKNILHGSVIGTYCYYSSYQRGTFVDERAGAVYDGISFVFQIRVN